METNDELAQLEQLLYTDLNCDNPVKRKEPSVQDVDIFNTPFKEDNLPEGDRDKTSAIHNGDTDSSDDEERKNYTERKYHDYGSLVKTSLDQKEHEQVDKRLEFESRLRDTNRDLKISKITAKKSTQNVGHSEKHTIFSAPEIKNKGPADILTDPVFGIRITKPIISSTALLDRMQGREAVNILRVKRYVENEDLSKDWVIAGVIIKKSSSKKSQKGNQFIVWTLSDLKDDIKTVSMFLFRKAYNDLWKTTEGTVVAVLNPNVLERSENSKDQACLSVENSDRVMILGQSKDLGICKSKKKNGEPCTAVVNMSQGEHCIYHIKQEYQKYSRRQELQSSTMGKGLINLQNKVFGKNTFMYGGKSYSALQSGNNKAIKDRDQNRLMSLSDYYKSEGDKLITNKAPCPANILQNKSGLLHSPKPQKTSDTQRLNALSHSPLSNPSLAEKVANSPTLGKGFSLKGKGTIDLNMSYSQKCAERAKLNAVKLIQQNGGIEKIDPNNIKGTETGKKRAIEKLLIDTDYENCCKKAKCNDGSGKLKINIVSKSEDVTLAKKPMSERFKKILEATSAHVNLIKAHENDEQDKYFNKLEKKEAMEEKMLNTFKIACKAVRCAKCKYTAFSAAELCKTERHPIKVIDTFKRFFKCGDCNNRTISFEVLPLHSCSNCRSSRWLKAPMMREKKELIGETLSIRGEEEGFIGAEVTAGKNINLLVPDSS